MKSNNQVLHKIQKGIPKIFKFVNKNGRIRYGFLVLTEFKNEETLDYFCIEDLINILNNYKKNINKWHRKH